MPREICPHCKQEIDPETCWCGDSIESHGAAIGHSAVPMGCNCGREFPAETDDD